MKVTLLTFREEQIPQWDVPVMQAILLCEYFARFRGRRAAIRPSKEFESVYVRVSSLLHLILTRLFYLISSSFSLFYCVNFSFSLLDLSSQQQVLNLHSRYTTRQTKRSYLAPCLGPEPIPSDGTLGSMQRLVVAFCRRASSWISTARFTWISQESATSTSQPTACHPTSRSLAQLRISGMHLVPMHGRRWSRPREFPWITRRFCL